MASHLLGHRVLRCVISLVPGEGAATLTDHDGDQRELAIVVRAGPVSEIDFDNRHNANDPRWVDVRAGMIDHDRVATIHAINSWMADRDVTERQLEYEAIEEEARQLLATEDARRMIDNVAEALDAELVLDEDRLSQLLQ